MKGAVRELENARMIGCKERKVLKI